MISKKDAEDILNANGISYNELQIASLNLSAVLGNEMSYQLGDSILIGHISVFSNDPAAALRLGVWDYTRRQMVSLNFAGTLSIDNMLVLLNDVSTSGGVNVVFTFNGYKALVL